MEGGLFIPFLCTASVLAVQLGLLPMLHAQVLVVLPHLNDLSQDAQGAVWPRYLTISLVLATFSSRWFLPRSLHQITRRRSVVILPLMHPTTGVLRELCRWEHSELGLV